MSDFMQNASNSPGGVRDSRYVKTSEYQMVKILRSVIRLLEIATKAIITMGVDIVKGLTGKS